MLSLTQPEAYEALVAAGTIRPVGEWARLVLAARFLGHGQPWLQAEQPLFWTEAAALAAEALEEVRAERERDARGG